MDVLLPVIPIIAFGILALLLPRLNLPWTVYVAYLVASALFFLGMAFVEGPDDLYPNLFFAALAIGFAIRHYRIRTAHSAGPHFNR